MVTEFLESVNLKHSVDEENGIIRFGINGENGSFNLLIDVQPEREMIKCYSVVPINVPVAKRSEIAEYLTRANYGLHFGNFELDFSDGEVRFKTSMNTDGNAANPSVIRHLVLSNINITDDYLKGLMRVLYADLSPEQAIDEIENKNEDNGGDGLGGEGGIAPPVDE